MADQILCAVLGGLIGLLLGAALVRSLWRDMCRSGTGSKKRGGGVCVEK